MAWLAVDKDGQEVLFLCENKPVRSEKMGVWYSNDEDFIYEYQEWYLRTFSIEDKIGRKLTWDDEPVEI